MNPELRAICDRHAEMCNSNHHAAKLQILKYFTFGHLPPHLQDISAPFCSLA